MMDIQTAAQHWHSSKSDYYKQTELELCTSFYSFVCLLHLSLMHLCWIEFNPNVSDYTIILAQMYRYILNLLYL